MKIKLVICFFLLCGIESNAQFIKNLDIEVSHGWMWNHNKGSIDYDKFVSLQGDPATESNLWTKMLSISLGYRVSDMHAFRMSYNYGHVGSILNGRFYGQTGFEGPLFMDLMEAPNRIKYRSYGIHYVLSLPIDDDCFLFQIGMSRQKNVFHDALVPMKGIFDSNYNVSASLGFSHSVISNLDLVPRVTIINSFDNDNDSYNITDSRFVPIQVGFELGIRFKPFQK